MPDVPTPGRAEFVDIGRMLNFPGAECVVPSATRPVRLEAGKESWETFTARGLPTERAAILHGLAPWWSPELVATEPGREKLARWGRLGRPAPSRRVLDRDLTVLGLAGVRAMLVSATRKMPPPVQHWCVHHTWILGVGRREHGWTWQAPPPPPGPLVLIAVDGRLDAPPSLVSVFAHEVAHAWLRD